MRPTMTRLTLALAIALALGGSVAEAQLVRPLARTYFVRPIQPVAVRPTTLSSGTPTAAPAPARPGRLTAVVDENGAHAPSSVHVRRGGRLVASGSSATPIELPAGTYDVTITLETALDRPTRTVRVSVPEGGTATARASFRTSIIEVRFTKDRTAVHGLATLRQGGRVIGTLGSGVTARVSAGTYEIDARYRTEQRTYTVALAPEQRRALRADF